MIHDHVSSENFHATVTSFATLSLTMLLQHRMMLLYDIYISVLIRKQPVMTTTIAKFHS